MQRARLDLAAIVLSGLCMIHCLASLAGLFALGLLSVMGAMDEVFHVAMLVMIVPVSVLAMGLGYRQHRKPGVLVTGTLALTLLCLLAALEEVMHGTLWEPVLTSVVGLCLVATHVANIRACRHCEVNDDRPTSCTS